MPFPANKYRYEAGHLDATEFLPDSLARLTWRWRHLDVGDIL